MTSESNRRIWHRLAGSGSPATLNNSRSSCALRGTPTSMVVPPGFDVGAGPRVCRLQHPIHSTGMPGEKIHDTAQPTQALKMFEAGLVSSAFGRVWPRKRMAQRTLISAGVQKPGHELERAAAERAHGQVPTGFAGVTCCPKKPRIESKICKSLQFRVFQLC